VSSDFDPFHQAGRLPGGCNWQLAHEPESNLSEGGLPCRKGL